MKSKLMKIVTIGIFAVAMLLNISVYFDTNDSSNADLSLGNLKVSLFQKAYACGNLCDEEPWASACPGGNVKCAGVMGDPDYFCYQK